MPAERPPIWVVVQLLYHYPYLDDRAAAQIP